MNAAHIHHGGGGDDHTGDAEEPAHRQLALAEGMLDRPNSGLDGGTQVSRRTAIVTMVLTPLGPEDFGLGEVEGKAGVALLGCGATATLTLQGTVGTDAGIKTSHKAGTPSPFDGDPLSLRTGEMGRDTLVTLFNHKVG